MGVRGSRSPAKNAKSSEDSRGVEAAAADVNAFELHLRQIYLYYKARRRRGQAVLLVSSAWACYNVSVWVRGWMESGGHSWFLLLNTVGSVALAGACLKSNYRDSRLYVPDRYEKVANGILAFLGLCFDGAHERSLRRRQSTPPPPSGVTSREDRGARRRNRRGEVGSRTSFRFSAGFVCWA
eukprot:g9685.t1